MAEVWRSRKERGQKLYLIPLRPDGMKLIGCSGTVETQTEETDVTTKEASCQTLSDEDGAVDKLRTAITEGNNFTPKVHIVESDILGAPKDQNLAIITSGDRKLEKGIARRYRERFGGIEELQAQGKGRDSMPNQLHICSIYQRHG
nr:unnamed protein product [Callosobruchus analis]